MDKLYHAQPCYCLACKALRNKQDRDTQTRTVQIETDPTTTESLQKPINAKKRGRPKKA